MKQTRKKVKATYHGLHKWYEEMFEHLGWMILAKSKGYDDKIEVYKNSLKRLKEGIENKISTTKDSDKKDDLKIMWDNLNILITHANKDL